MTGPIPSKPTRIYVDVSETLGLDVRTGIQRVVREICRKAQAADSQFELIPVVAIAGQLHQLSARGRSQLHSPPATTYVPAAPYRTPMLIRLARALLSPFPKLVRKARQRRAAKLFDARLAPFAEGAALHPATGDRLVLADTYTHSTILRAGGRAQHRGAALIVLTYDVFPLTHAYLLEEESVDIFVRGVPPTMEASDGVLTISDWCIGEIRSLGVTKPLGRFYLGYDIPTDLAGAEQVDLADWPRDLWDDGSPVFLMVGTIATSKGHDVAIAAFERLWGEGVEAKLLMVGRPGWEVETLIRRLNEHPELGRKLFLVHGASDAMVDEAFRRAFAAIIASVVEGFGLPLVEALARSLPVIASDIPVFREIAGDVVLRYEQSDPAALAQAVKTMIARRQTYAARAAAFEWIDWNTARDAFALETDRLARQAGK